MGGIVQERHAHASELFRRIRDARDLEYRALCDRVEAIVSPLLCKPLDPGLDVPTAELDADGLPKGTLVHRTRRFASVDGDEMWVFFDGTSSFKKPWPFPDQERLLSRGGINVRVDDNFIWGLALELWWVGETPSLHVREGSRIVPFTEDHLDRGARILVGLAWPGLAGPYHSPDNRQSWPVDFMRYRRDFERLGLPLDAANWVKNLVHFTLVTPLQQDLYDAARRARLGSDLYRFFESPTSARPALVRGLGQRMLEAVGLCFLSIFRVDVEEVDDAARTLKVVFEAKPPTGPDVSWTFNLASSPPILPGLQASLISTDIRPPKDEPKPKKAKSRQKKSE